MDTMTAQLLSIAREANDTLEPATPQGLEASVISMNASKERLAYSFQEAADAFGLSYHTIWRLVQRGKLRACHAIPGKGLIPRSELLRLLKDDATTARKPRGKSSGCR